MVWIEIKIQRRLVRMLDRFCRRLTSATSLLPIALGVKVVMDATLLNGLENHKKA